MTLMTLVYLQNGDETLMLHRVKKANDVNEGKWIGVGGKFEANESPYACASREVYEETGSHFINGKFRGVVTFVYGQNEPDYLFLYTGELDNNHVRQNDEGVLKWVKTSEIPKLDLWEGDLLFLDPLFQSSSVIDLTLRYNDARELIQVENYNH